MICACVDNHSFSYHIILQLLFGFWDIYWLNNYFFLQLFVCEQVLEQEGVYGHVEIDELELDLIPLDRDILSLELPDFFRSFYLVGKRRLLHKQACSSHDNLCFLCCLHCGTRMKKRFWLKNIIYCFNHLYICFKCYFLFQHGDQTNTHTIAQSLVHIQQLFGLIPRVYGVGRCAKVSLTAWFNDMAQFHSPTLD